MGPPTFALPSFRVHIDAAASRSDVVRLGEGVARLAMGLAQPRASTLKWLLVLHVAFHLTRHQVCLAVRAEAAASSV